MACILPISIGLSGALFSKELAHGLLLLKVDGFIVGGRHESQAEGEPVGQ